MLSCSEPSETHSPRAQWLMQSRLWVYWCVLHHMWLQNINAQWGIWWYRGCLSWLMYGSRIHSVSVCLWGNLSFTPEYVIISTSWRNALFLAQVNVLFSGRLLLELALHMPAHMCVFVKVLEKRDILLELHALVDRNVGWSRHISMSSTHKRYVCPMWQEKMPTQHWCHCYSCQESGALAC